MAVTPIFSDTMVTYGNTDDAVDINSTGWWTVSLSGTQALDFQDHVNGRRVFLSGGGITAGLEAKLTLPTTYSSIFWYMEMHNPTAALNLINFRFYNGNTLNFYIKWTNGTTLTVYRGDGVSQGTMTLPSTAENNFRKYSFKVTCHDTNGAVELYYEGALVTGLSGIDTNNGGSNLIDNVRFYFDTGGTSCYLTNVIVQDGSNGAHITPVSGEGKVPNGAGNSNQWATNAGAGDANNYQKIDEKPNSTTDYCESNVVGNGDSLTVEDLTATAGSVKFVAWTGRCSIDTVGSNKIIPTVRIGGVTYEGTAITLTTTNKRYQYFWTTNPATSTTWTISDINSAEFGYKVGT